MRCSTASPARRICRRHPIRWLAVVALLPLLLLSPFTGRTLVPHRHEGHGTHFHALEAGERTAAAMRQLKQDCLAVRQCHDPHEHDPVSPEDDSAGVTVPSFEPVRGRGLEVAWAAGSWPCWPAAGGFIWRAPIAAMPIATETARGGVPPGARLWRAQDRLIRTSQALLIRV